MDPVPLAVVLLVDPRGWVLLQERDEGAPRAANQWGMVGGHVEDGEEFEPAAYRELLEETGVALPAGTLRLWQDAQFAYDDGFRGRYHLYAAGVDLTDADIVVGEGRQIVFVEPAVIPTLDLAESTRHFVPDFLASDLYRSFRRAS
ncbi:NUDIX domain-containing protein [Nocardioides pocheonensis]|uniref:NUDIX domain-containing protein n=1 Tax=Nocardioides pocheonensis TaxID=661485 RepID=A0A3N0GUF8_9ACTN|nr:NUDIX hydrolase [Nocardioides pocheonensis]RNM16097.1 NUDIX domain-containing protein [Nocardioides pocheonensis]